MEQSKKLQKESLGSTAVPFKTLSTFAKVQEIAGKCVCKIKTKHDQGTCTFYKFAQSETTRFLLMTCNHVMPTSSVSDIIEAELEFEDIPQLKSLNLVKEQVKYVWTSQLYDTTIVEIPPEQSEVLTKIGIQFLEVGKAELNAKIAIPQYPLGIFSIAYGDIEGLSGNDVFYRMGTAPGSSGAPLITWDCVALAMHNTGTVGAAGDQPNATRKAISLDPVIKAYLTEVSECEQNINVLKKQVSSSFEKKCADLKTINEQVKRENLNLKENVQQINKEVQQMHKENTDLKSDINKFKKECADLKTINEQVKRENSNLKENVQQMYKENTNLKSDINNFKAQVTELENEIRSIQESKKAELSALNKKISELRSEKDQTPSPVGVAKNIPVALRSSTQSTVATGFTSSQVVTPEAKAQLKTTGSMRVADVQRFNLPDMACFEISEHTGAGSNTLLLVDPQNDAVRSVNLDTKSSRIVYKCPPASLVRSVRMVHERLLVVERQGRAENSKLGLLGIMGGALPGAGQTQSIWLVLAAPDGNGAYSEIDHERLNSAPVVNMGNVVSLCSARNDRVLCAVTGSDALDVYRVEGNTLHSEGHIDLSLSLFCFVTDEVDLMLVSRFNSNTVAILRVSDWSDKAVEAMATITDGDCSRLLFCGNGFLLVGNSEGDDDDDDDDKGHQINCWRLSNSGREATLLGEVDLRSSNGRRIQINTWTTVGGRVVLFDTHTKQLVQAKLQYSGGGKK